MTGLVKAGHHTLIVGKTGTGKTVLIQGMLNVLDENKYCYYNVNFSA
jgi:type IV secretory pathway VirB4 component